MSPKKVLLIFLLVIYCFASKAQKLELEFSERVAPLTGSVFISTDKLLSGSQCLLMVNTKREIPWINYKSDLTTAIRFDFHTGKVLDEIEGYPNWHENITHHEGSYFFTAGDSVMKAQMPLSLPVMINKSNGYYVDILTSPTLAWVDNYTSGTTFRTRVSNEDVVIHDSPDPFIGETKVNSSEPIFLGRNKNELWSWSGRTFEIHSYLPLTSKGSLEKSSISIIGDRMCLIDQSDSLFLMSLHPIGTKQWEIKKKLKSADRVAPINKKYFATLDDNDILTLYNLDGDVVNSKQVASYDNFHAFLGSHSSDHLLLIVDNYVSVYKIR